MDNAFAMLLVAISPIIFAVILQIVIAAIEQHRMRTPYRIALIKTNWEVQLLAIGVLAGQLFKDIMFKIWNQAYFDLYCLLFVCVFTIGMNKIRSKNRPYEYQLPIGMSTILLSITLEIPTHEDVSNASWLSGMSLFITLCSVVILSVGGKV